MANESDSDDELPAGWNEQVNEDGSVVFINSTLGLTSSEHPVTHKRKSLPKELPFGWIEEFDGGKVFVNVESGQRSVVDPRLAFKVEDSNTYRQRYDSHSSCWDVLEGMNLSSKTVLITGGSGGIGWQTALSLASHGAEVIFTTRDLRRSEQDVERAKLKRAYLKLRPMFVDFLELDSVRSFADEFISSHSKLNVLLLNAGVCGQGFQLSKNDFESTFQVNHLAQFYLFRQLQRVLLKSTPCRVVVLSSESHRFSFLSSPEQLNIKRLIWPHESPLWTSMVAYNDSKLLNILFAREVDRRFSKSGIRALAVHPGNMIRTNLSRYWWLYRFLFFIVSPFTKTIEQGAATSVYAAVSSDMEGRGALYLNNCCICSPSKAAVNDRMAEKLWTVSESILRDINML